jgi:hypothetical protein
MFEREKKSCIVRQSGHLQKEQHMKGKRTAIGRQQDGRVGVSKTIVYDKVVQVSRFIDSTGTFIIDNIPNFTSLFACTMSKPRELNERVDFYTQDRWIVRSLSISRK